MKRSVYLGALLFSGLAIVAAVTVWAQLPDTRRVFPQIRWDDVTQEAGPTPLTGGIQAEALRLVPADAAPFACEATKNGWLAVFHTEAPDATQSDFLCICAELFDEFTFDSLGFHWAGVAGHSDPIDFCVEPVV